MKVMFHHTAITIVCLFCSALTAAAEPVITIDTPMAPPDWALLERELLEANSEAAAEFASHYLDSRGYLLHTPRWGTLDGTDDAVETFKEWTILHALGGADTVLTLFKHALEGHYLQYSEVTTDSTDVAADGCYYREFMPMSDWMHQGEGMQGLMHQGLSDPLNLKLRHRYTRFAGFYLNEYADAQNYDPEHRIIRSFWNGSKGPMLRNATQYDWAGDPTKGMFHLLHNRGGRRYMMRYEDEFPNILHHFYYFVQSSAGDHALNLCATQLALNAYMLTHDEKYRDWLAGYAGAWRKRAEENGGNFPTNIGLDGSIGGAFDGAWYKGTYGWNFSYWHWNDHINHENTTFWGIWPGMGNALMVTGDQRYVDALRSQMDTMYAQKKSIDGREMIPRNYGIHIDRDQPRKYDVFDVAGDTLTVPEGKEFEGWYNWTPNLFVSELIDIYLMSMNRNDIERIRQHDWIQFLEGANPEYPAKAFRGELEHIRRRMAGMRQDPTTPDSRLADWALYYNPVTIHELVRLTLGGNLTGRIWTLHTRVRYFDPEQRRAGLPDDVAALVTGMNEGTTQLTLININQVEPRTVIVQTGAYGEHQCRQVILDSATTPVNSRWFTVHIAPGAGADITITAERYCNQPSLAFPWHGDTVPIP